MCRASTTSCFIFFVLLVIPAEFWDLAKEFALSPSSWLSKIVPWIWTIARFPFGLKWPPNQISRYLWVPRLLSGPLLQIPKNSLFDSEINNLVLLYSFKLLSLHPQLFNSLVLIKHGRLEPPLQADWIPTSDPPFYECLSSSQAISLCKCCRVRLSC